MRIGTWNLAGRLSAEHQRLIEGENCDVWFLTEVPNALSLATGQLFRSAPMTQTKSWAAVWSRGGAAPWSSPHPAAATAVHDGVLLCSCVLPWRSARASWPAEDAGNDVATITTSALARLGAGIAAAELPVIWGGDWNHALHGRDYSGTKRGRGEIEKLVSELGLQVPTRHLPHAIADLLSIDHIAVPTSWDVTACRRVVAALAGKRLSDHDAYVVDCTPR